LSISALAQECQPDYWKENLKELRQTDEYQLAYLDYGFGEPVVLIHGALSDYRVWLHQIEDLRRDYHVISPSLRISFPNSLSRSPNTPAAETWSNTEDVIELIEHLGVGRVHLVGHSGGGAVALDVAVRRPDLLRSLILAEPALGTGEPPPEIQTLFAGVAAQIGRGETKAAVRDFMTFASGPGYFDSLSAECQQMLTDNAATIAVVALSQVLPDTTCAAAGTVQAPVLYIQGETSPLRDSPFKECLPPHESVTIPNVSHSVHTDDPRRFNEAVRDFVGRN
jgi:pimeloyl-ACP methyl ester carboxylesterase